VRGQRAEFQNSQANPSTESIRLRIPKVASQAEARENGTHLIGPYDQEATTSHSNYSAKTKSSVSTETKSPGYAPASASILFPAFRFAAERRDSLGRRKDSRPPAVKLYLGRCPRLSTVTSRLNRPCRDSRSLHSRLRTVRAISARANRMFPLLAPRKSRYRKDA